MKNPASQQNPVALVYEWQKLYPSLRFSSSEQAPGNYTYRKTLGIISKTHLQHDN
jgi:hypothetical protein